MLSTLLLPVIGVLVTIAPVYGYRAFTALMVCRSLPSKYTTITRREFDGERMSLTGELVVDEPVETGEAAVANADRPVGAYVWRARLPNDTNSDLNLGEADRNHQEWHTFASGIEYGRIGVADDGRMIPIDLSWFEEVSEADVLGKLEVGGITTTGRRTRHLWNSWYHCVRNRTEYCSFRRFAAYVQRHNDGIDLDRYRLEARPVLEGTTVSVSGELRMEDGEPVLSGTDETPLLVSDQGFDGHRRWLRRAILRNAGMFSGMVVAALGLVVGVYLPLAVLLVGLLASVGYHFVQDAEHSEVVQRRLGR